MAIGRQAATPSEAGILNRPTWTTGWASWLTTVDHKRLGLLYIVSSFIFLGFGSVEAFLIRLQLARPEQQLISPDVFNQMFTMHGVTMVFLAIMPLGIGFANYFVPLMIGARDLAFPRLNAFGYWVYALAGLFLYTSFFLGGAPDVGWFAYAPLTSLSNNPGNGVDFFMIGLLVSGVGTLVTAMNLIVTVVNLRAPGMTFMRLPLFVWMMMITSFLIIFAFPPLTIALFQVIMDRTFGTLFYVPEAGGLPILWQHLFWIFGHPEVYIIILPAFGVISEVIPTFSRKPLFGYPIMVLSGLFIGFMGFAVWSHHMFTTGLGPVANTAFALTSFVIGIPTGIKIFNWIATMWGGHVRFAVPMLYATAFLITFTLGGITGVMLAVPPFDAQVQDSYFVVAHFHFVMGGGALLSFLAGLYYWFPKMSGRMLPEGIGKLAFWLVVPGFYLIFWPQHFAGLVGMPRRVQTYEAGIGLDAYNLMSTSGTFVFGAGLLLVLFSAIWALKNGKIAGNDPWDGRTLEWATTSPPPHYDFEVVPEINDRDPVWLMKHPELIERRDIISEAVDPEHAPPKHVEQESIHIPGQSWYPFIAALGTFIGSYALLYQNLFLGLFSALVIFIACYAWAFEGVGGYHEHIEPAAGGQA
jgi:cytochrome c oxidase subunit 1